MSIQSPETAASSARNSLNKRSPISYARILDHRFSPTTVARNSGISGTHLRSLLHGEKQMSILIFLELSEAPGFDDACQLLRSVLDRRDQRLRDDTEQHHPSARMAIAANGFRQSLLNLVASSRR